VRELTVSFDGDNSELAEDIILLWAHPVIQNAFSRRHEFWILDGAEYYFERIKEATAPGFLPTEEDVIMARARTTGSITAHCDTNVTLQCGFCWVASVITLCMP
jgi:hypothetical protein